MIIYAPYPFVLDVILLPQPSLSNQEVLQDTRDYRVSMDKTVHSYVKRTPKRVYIFDFVTTRYVADRFNTFLQSYFQEQWRILDHHNTELIGHVISNPHTQEFSGVYTTPCVGKDGYSNNERVTFQIDFEA